MIDFRRTADGPNDTDYIETDRDFYAMRLDVVVDGRLQAEAFLVVDGLFWGSKQSVAPSLHFYDG